MWYRVRVTVSHTAALSSISNRIGIFHFFRGLGIRRDGEAETQSFVSVPNIPRLKTKSLCSAYIVKVCVLVDSKFVCWVGMLNLVTPLVLFNKSRLILALGFTFTLPYLTFIHHAHYTANNTYTYIQPWHLLMLTNTHYPAVMQKYKMGHSIISIHSKVVF